MAFTHALYQPDPPESDSGPILTMLNCNTQAGAEAYLSAFPGAALCTMPPDFSGTDTTHRIENGAPVPL